MTQETMTTEIAEYSATAAAIGELRAKYEGVLFPVETSAGMKDAMSARKELRDIRIGLEKTRKEIKEPALRRCQMIDQEAKAITAKLTALEDPIDAQIKAEEQRKEREKQERERIERERVAGIREKIDAIRALPAQSIRDTAAEIGATLADLTAFEITEAAFAEFAADATTTRHQAMGELREMMEAAKAREEAEAIVAAERAELQRLRAEAEERARIEAERLAAERAELERMRAELEAQKAAAVSVAHAGAEIEQPTVETEQQPDPVEPEPAPDVSEEPEDADAIVSELAGYVSMQFIALSKKIAAIGFEDYASELAGIGKDIAKGEFNDAIKTGNWTDMANADKEMAIASHACVSLILGDAEMGESVLRQAA